MNLLQYFLFHISFFQTTFISKLTMHSKIQKLRLLLEYSCKLICLCMLVWTPTSLAWFFDSLSVGSLAKTPGKLGPSENQGHVSDLFQYKQRKIIRDFLQPFRVLWDSLPYYYGLIRQRQTYKSEGKAMTLWIHPWECSMRKHLQKIPLNLKFFLCKWTQSTNISCFEF